MGSKLIECVPNISEGRDREIIDKIVGAIENGSDARILHVDSSIDANRTVVTFAGSPQEVQKGALAMAQCAYSLIDMSKHSGEHPRVGAVDVCPFVPLVGITKQECIALAEDFASNVASLLGIPVFMYAHNAREFEKTRLVYVRKGGYEQLKNKMIDGSRCPEYGAKSLHPTFGAMIVGARDLMVAYNVTLSTSDSDIAQRIASFVRESVSERQMKLVPDHLINYTKLEGVEAIGWFISSYGATQVSMNLRKGNIVGITRAFDACRNWAKEFGCEVIGSELIGLMSSKHVGVDTIADDNCSNLKLSHLKLDAHRPFDAQERILEVVLRRIFGNFYSVS